MDAVGLAGGMVALFFLPGHAVLLAATRRCRERYPAAPALLLTVTLSVLLTTGVAHALATAGCLRLSYLFAGVAAVTLPALVLALRARRNLWPWAADPGSLLPLLLVPAALALYLPPDHFIFGGADEGTYVTAAAAVARTGGLLLRDEVLTALPPALRDLHSLDYLPGYYFLEGTTASPVLPHGFHFYVAFLAVFHLLGGTSLTFAGNAFCAAWMVLAAALLLRRAAGPLAGAALGALTAVNPLTVWFSRVTFAETLVAALVVSACSLLALGWPARGGSGSWSRLCIFAAGMALGATHLAKFDFFYLPLVVLGAACLFWSRRMPGMVPRALLWGFVPFFLLAVAYAFGPHRAYLSGLLENTARFLGLGEVRAAGLRLEPGLAVLVGGLGTVAAVGLFLFAARRRLRRLVVRLRVARVDVAAGTAILVLGALLLFAVPNLRPDIAATVVPWEDAVVEFRLWAVVQRLALPLTALGFLLALPGAGLLLRWHRATPLLPAAALALAQLAVAAASQWGTDWLTRFFHAGRRVFLVLPLLLGCTLALPFLRGLPWPRLRRLAGAALVVYLGSAFLRASLPHLHRRPWGRSLELLGELQAAAPERVVWLARSDDGLARRWLVPLRFLAGQPTFLCREDRGDPRTYGLLVQALMARGFAPVFLLGEVPPAEGTVDGRLAYLPAVRVTLTDPPVSPLWVVGADYGVRKRIVEEALAEPLLRLPDAGAYHEWLYELVLLRPW